ncbi:helix-turn-helix transcriptional regulator [Coraliomargarita parva]|uniref:helix-turn-helix transcriptional regulator n=1 Tax=Coraliomargarita parva TaxID=3014050 RepID=UPI0022B40F9A|nr:AraC family transcriptional regulator [Coraliomargarita parva]
MFYDIVPVDVEHSKLAIPLSDWASLTCSLIWIYDDEVPAFGYHREVVANQESVVWLIRDGAAQVRSAGKEWNLRAGDWFFLPDHDYWQDFSPQARLLSIRFKANWITGVPLFRHGDGFSLKAEAHHRLETVAVALNRFFKRTLPRTDGYLRATSATTDQYLHLQQRLMTWLQVYAETLMSVGLQPTRLSPVDPRMLRVARDLDNWPLSVPLDEVQLAAQANLGDRQLSRLFQQEFGMTPSRYFNGRKLKSARSALEAHERNIKEIAYSLGFKSLSHFSTWFRKQTGRSPRAYRKNHYEYHPRGRPVSAEKG